MKKFKFNIKREIRVGVALIVLVVLISFSERKQDAVDLQNIVVKIDNVGENHFLDEEDVMRLMQMNNDNVKGANLQEIDFKMLENKIKVDKFVKDAEIYSDLKGNLMVNVKLRRPIARIVRGDGPDGYIAEDGTIMPVSDQFTSRVVLVSGSFVPQILRQENLTKMEMGTPLIDMLNIINKDSFWHAQVAQLDIDSHANVTIYPQVSGQIVEFGKIEDLEIKFRKLKIFYKEILPRMGWNKYKRVNLEYEGQIVAE